MKIIVKAKTKAKINKVERVEQSSMDFSLGKDKAELLIYKVSVKAAPVAGKANEAIIKALAEYFDIAPARVILVSGQSSLRKVFAIN
jgi:uncharacterized protein YggU (UPF0235/DUF167 family)